MEKHEFRQFAERWADAHEIMAGGKVFTQRSMTLVFDALEDYPLEAVFQAIKIHTKQGKFAPSPADIGGIIAERTGAKHIGCEEAWSIALESFDEYSTVVWTQPIAEARAIASSLYFDGDKVAARMAFKGAYDRLCSEAVMMQRPVVWSICIGFDKSLIEPVLQKAVAAGRISQDRANKFLPPPADSGVIAGLLTGKVTELPNNDANLKAKWGELKQAMADGQRKLAEKEHQRVLDAEQERLAFEKRRQEMLDRVADKLQKKA